MAEMTLTVNGATRTVDVAPDTPLVYVLRNQFMLGGVRLGCGMSQCGACAVLVDGREVRSCVTLASRVAGSKIHTIEGLPALWAEAREGTAAGGLHPVQQAWIDEQVPQCGYCQSGMMIAAVDLLARVPSPSVAQIREAFTDAPPSPHLCRCGTYPAIIDAVQRAARAMAL
ncbi:MAG: (2Fe-2S)-binding protein [Acidimicrobiia bacterium]|nr:(2Fe-2S)-binding protein [Acidimicrobiia bacterium]